MSGRALLRTERSDAAQAALRVEANSGVKRCEAVNRTARDDGLLGAQGANIETPIGEALNGLNVRGGFFQLVARLLFDPSLHQLRPLTHQLVMLRGDDSKLAPVAGVVEKLPPLMWSLVFATWLSIFRVAVFCSLLMLYSADAIWLYHYTHKMHLTGGIQRWAI